MRIIVISDTHHLSHRLNDIVMKQKDADLFIHLGDGEKEYQLLLERCPELKERFHYVKGNCDLENYPISKVIDVMPGHRIFAVHGHKYGVNSSLDMLTQYAREAGCDIALYGHTHVSKSVFYNGIHVLNPGSAALPRDGNPPSYGVVDVSSAGVMTNIVFVR